MNTTGKKTIRWIGGLLICFSVILDQASAIAKQHIPPPPSHISEPIAASAPVQIPVVPQPLIVSVRSLPDAPEKSVWSDSGTYVAIVTGVLAVVTWLLAMYTRKLAIDAKESGAKTTRAYVQLSSGEFNVPINQAAPDRELRFDLFNTGQTPAREIEFWYHVVPYPVADPAPRSDTLYFPVGSRLNPPAKLAEIGSGKHGEIRYSIQNQLQLQLLTGASTASAKNGNLVFIEGIVIYKDVYEKEQKIYFKRCLAPNKKGLVATADHNFST